MDNNINYIVLDLETSDPWIAQGRGSGWPEKQTKFLCASLYHAGHLYYYSDIEEVKRHISNAGSFVNVVAHNAQYEAGVLYSYGFDIESVTWIDTMILAKLFNNNEQGFSLDHLAEKYLGEKKDEAALGEVAKELGLVKSKVQNPVKVAKENMERIFERNPDVVKGYVEQDVKLCNGLYNHYAANLDIKMIRTLDYHSDLIKCLTLSRAKGIKIHVRTLLDIEKELKDSKNDLVTEARNMTDINLASGKQLAEYFDLQGVEYPRHNPTPDMRKKDPSSKGNPNIDKIWLKSCEHPLAKLISDIREIDKLLSTYIDPVVALVKPGHRYVKIYPQINIYGAAVTGRCSSSNPNIQNVPKRGSRGAVIRKMYVPDQGNKLASLDFSGQELKLILHFAYGLGLPGAAELVKEFKANPLYDMHQVGADVIGIKRGQAKEINLGLAYGLWEKTLADKLKITQTEARKHMAGIDRVFPFLKMLGQLAQEYVRRRGYVTTIGGRKVYLDKAWIKDALNSKSQGSGADQTNKALVECYRQGIPVWAPIHDEIIIEYADDETLEKVKNIMETSTQLSVPNIVGVKTGLNWGELE